MGNFATVVQGDAETRPNYKADPTFDSLYGFNEGRKERKMIATEEEMVSVGLPLKKRDYCAHLAIKHRGCRYQNWPMVYRCAHEKHEYLQCQYEDYVLRMKEFERERRLLERAQRKAVRASRAASEELEE